MVLRSIPILIFCLLLSMKSAFSQKGLQVYGGLSLMYSENPLTNHSNEAISGYHLGLGGSMGSGLLYFHPGLELHILQQQSFSSLNPFEDLPKLYLVKLPLQAGLRFVHKESFSLRGMTGVSFSIVSSIDKNNLPLDDSNVKDAQYGLLFGGGIDIYALSFDIRFEKGISAFYTEKDYKADFITMSLGFSF